MKPKSYLKNLFSRQRGALFSMDARIALVIASVVAGVIGIQAMQRIERARVDAAEDGIIRMMDALEGYYRNVSLSSLPPTFDSGAGNYVSVIFDTGRLNDPTLQQDPWGEDWIYDTCTSEDQTIEGITMDVHYAVLYSMGPDATNDSHEDADVLEDATCAADFAAFELTNDDIGQKFNTLSIERARVTRTHNQMDQIVSALQAYETQMFLANQTICTGLSQAAATARTPGCNVDGNGTYDTSEEVKLNYFPHSTLDNTATSGATYLVPSAGGAFATDNQGQTSYDPSSQTQMETFLQLLGLSTNLVLDPWGRRLCYHSNLNMVAQSPFTVSIRYDDSCS